MSVIDKASALVAEIGKTPSGRAMDAMRQRLYSNRRLVAKATYALVTAAAYATAFELRFELNTPAVYRQIFAPTLVLLILFRLVCAGAFRLSTGRWRFVSTRDAIRLVGAVFLSSGMFFSATRLLPFGRLVPVSIILIEAVVAIYMTAGVWIGYRTIIEELRRRRSDAEHGFKRVIIIGAGEAGNLLGREIMRYPTGYKLVAYVDDNPMMWGSSLHGVEIIGAGVDLPKIAQNVAAEELIIAMPSGSPEELRRIVTQCDETGLPYKVLPGISAVLAGRVSVEHLRKIRIEDLLGREPIHLELPELAQDLAGRSVLVTGAAGSIGSELSNQIALNRPACLILLDQAETPMFYLLHDLRRNFPNVEIVSIIGDIGNRTTVERVFQNYAPDRVFHAAAYKHVPMMETNPIEAIRNNVIGTWRVADAAGRYGCGKFVMVSTDKAVQPTSVMGASKRLAEFVVLDLQKQYSATSYAGVRFGNVLGSSGSVIPIFKRQIEAGLPLTVTDPLATRYFMTIAEAVQLILQASLRDEVVGHIAMLEMGEPIRILDLAKTLLRLSGAPGGGTDSVQFTGLRPGEKLHEELVAPDEDTIPTALSKVRVVLTRSHGSKHFISMLANWDRLLLEGHADEVLREVQAMFPLLRQFDVPTARRAPATTTGAWKA